MRFRFAMLIAFMVSSCFLLNSQVLAQDDSEHEKKTDQQSSDDGFESLFDGESLEGWQGKETFWRVEDGFITGQTTKENPTEKNTFLIWQGGDIADFELRLKFKIMDGNSGIQFRSKDLDDFVAGGYQADIDSKNTYMGILYEEKGRGILCPRTKKIEIAKDGGRTESDEPTCDDEAFIKSLKKDDWNEYVITAKGNHIVQTINGFVTVELTDGQTGKSASSGILALQLHAGPPMKIQFKEIELKKLDKE